MAEENENVRTKDLVETVDINDLTGNDYLLVDRTNDTVKILGDAIAPKSVTSSIAEVWIDNSTQAIKDKFYIRMGVLYKAKADYTGEWDSSKFEIATVTEILNVVGSIVDLNAVKLGVLSKDGKLVKVLDGVFVAKSKDLYKVKRTVDGIPKKLNLGNLLTGTIGSQANDFVWNSELAYHYIVDVSALRGLHVTDVTGLSRTYALLNFYKTPVSGELPFFCEGSDERYTGEISHLSIPEDACYLYVAAFNDYDFPTLTVDEAAEGVTEKLATVDSCVFGKKENSIAYSTIQGHVISSEITIGDAVEFAENRYRNVGKVEVPKFGMLCIDKVLGTTTGNNVAVCDADDVVIDLISYTADNSRTYPYYVNLEKYTNASHVYFNYSVNSSDYPVLSLNKSSINGAVQNKRKGVVILHFDGTETSDNHIVASRRALLAEYKIFKASACLSKSLFGNGDDNTFAAWKNSDIEAEYWDCVKAGWDFALYPSFYASQKDEAGWNAFMDTAFSNLANLNVHNITAWACGRLDVTHDLLKACIAHNIKILRGGSEGDATSQGDYDYTDENEFMTTLPTNETTLVNKTIFYNSNSNVERIKPFICRAADTQTAISIFTHQVYDGATGNTDCSTENYRRLLQVLKDMIDAGTIEIMTWREYYASISNDGYDNDYNRLLKMTLQNG